jgi:hypothetical protein
MDQNPVLATFSQDVVPFISLWLYDKLRAVLMVCVTCAVILLLPDSVSGLASVLPPPNRRRQGPNRPLAKSAAGRQLEIDKHLVVPTHALVGRRTFLCYVWPLRFWNILDWLRSPRSYLQWMTSLRKYHLLGRRRRFWENEVGAGQGVAKGVKGD